MTLYQPIKRHGGKRYLADWILSHAPQSYVTYCEPYFGGGAVLLRHDPEDHSEVINDIDGELMNFWECLADPDLFEQLRKLLVVTPFSQLTFEDAMVADFSAEERALRAQQFFIRARQSRQGLGNCFATMSKSRTRRGMNEQVSQWLGAIEGLPAIHERLRRVVILNDNAIDVIRRMDHPDTWFYLDPPYLHETRVVTDSYDHEMTHEQHVELLTTLGEIKGKFALSGYHSTLYDDVAMMFDWRRVEKQIDNKASSAAEKPVMTECLWMNY